MENGFHGREDMEEMGLSNGVTSGGFERDTNGTQREGGGGIWALNPRS